MVGNNDYHGARDPLKDYLMMQRITLLLLLLAAQAAFAQEAERSAEARARFPQPVLVGTLAGRQVLENRLNQRVLGRVEAVVQDSDGTINMIVRRASWPWDSRRCAVVPLAAMALLGQFVVLMDLNDAQFESLPNRCQVPGEVLAADVTIRVGLTKN